MTKKLFINIPLDDKKTFQTFQKGYTTGVFQFESGGMKRYLKQLKSTELEDIIAMVSLYRPGPIEFIPDFIGIGIDILNPVQPKATHMDTYQLKKEFGKEICNCIEHTRTLSEVEVFLNDAPSFFA